MKRFFQVVLAGGLFAFAPQALHAVPKPKGGNESPFDKLDNDKLTPFEKKILPEEAVGTIAVDSGSVVSCAFSSDGKLATGTDKGDVYLWDLTGDTPKPFATLKDAKFKTRVDRLAFTPDGKRLAGAVGGTLYVWDISEKGGKLFDSKDAGRVEGMAVSPDGKLIACGANLGQLYEIQAKGLAKLPGQFQGANSNYLFSNDGSLFASVFFQPARNGNLYGSEVKFWKVAKNKPTEFNIVELDSSIKALALSPDSNWLATGSLDNKVRLWDMTGKKPEVKVKMDSPKWIRNLAFTPDSEHLVGFSSGADIILYDVNKGEALKSWEFHPPQNSDFATGAMYLIFSATAVAPDGRHLAFSNNTGKTVILRLIATEKGKK